jgi:hypothetical protein
MHLLRHPRNAAALGLIFIVISVLFLVIPTIGGWHVDYAGATMLFGLGIAMAIMAYVLAAGTGHD